MVCHHNTSLQRRHLHCLTIAVAAAATVTSVLTSLHPRCPSPLPLQDFISSMMRKLAGAGAGSEALEPLYALERKMRGGWGVGAH